MNLKKLITILLVLTFLVQPVLAAEGKAAMGESLKEPALVSKGIENAPADLKGTIKVLDSNVSQYHIKATDNGISIKADLDKKDHTRELTVTRQALEKMKGFDGSRFYAHHFEDDGTYTGYQEVHIGKSQQVTFTVQFSEVLLSSFSGYYEVTQTLSSGQSLTLPAGAGRVDVSVGGEVPEYTVFDGFPEKQVLAVDYTRGLEGQGYPVTFYNTNLSESGFVFSGASGSYADAGTSASYDISGPLSIAATFSVSSTNQRAAIVNKYATINGQRVFALDIYDGNIRFLLSGDGLSGNAIQTAISANTEYVAVANFDGTNRELYLDMDKKATATGVSSVHVNNDVPVWIARGITESFYLNCTIKKVYIFNNSLNQSEINEVYYGFSGIQLSNQPYFGGTQQLNVTGDEVEYVATDGIAREVTARAFFTEDTTLISDTQGTAYQNISITHTAGNNTTSGQIVYAFNTTYQGTPTLESNNTAATVSKNTTHVTISTGELIEGQTFYYNMSIPKGSSGSPVNPSFAKPAGIFVAIAGAFAAGVGYFANRRRR